MNRIVTIAAVSFLLLAACTPQQDEIENQTEESANEAQQEMDGMDSATPIADSDTQASALEDEALSAQELLEQEDSPIASRVIYFEYDSAKVNDESMALLEAHGDFMSSNGNVNEESWSKNRRVELEYQVR